MTFQYFFRFMLICLLINGLSHETAYGQDRGGKSATVNRSANDATNQRAGETTQHASLPSTIVPNGLGINIHFTEPQSGEMKMLAAAGFKWVRMDFDWARTEAKSGVYDFAPYEKLLKVLDAFKLHAVFILDYENPLYEKDRSVSTEAGRKAYSRWAAAAVKKFKNRGVLWEIWNEPNIEAFWKPQPNREHYIAMALATAKAIHEVAPGEAMIGPGASTIDLVFLEGCFKAGLLKYWDAVSVHPYRQTGPESVANEYRKLRQLIATYAPKGKSIPILSGEWGYSATWYNFDVDKQGQMLPRQWLTNLANGIPLSIWYDWHDDGTDIKDPEHHFGTVAFKYHAGRNPVYDEKPAYGAAKTLTTTFAGCEFVKRIAVGNNDDFALLFRSGSKSRVAVWTIADPHDIQIPSGPGSCEVIEYTGKSRSKLSATGESFTVSISDSPQYLVFNDTNSVLAALPTAHPMKIGFAQAGKTMAVLIENQSDSDFKGKVRLVEMKGIDFATAELPLTLSSAEPEVSLHFPLTTAPPAEYRFGLNIENEAGEIILTLPSDWYGAIADDVLVGSKLDADGDANVPSEQSLSKSAAPVPPPNQDAPVLQLTYQFHDGWKYLRLAPQGEQQRKIPGEPKGVGLWIYGDGKQTVPRLRVIDATNQTWQPSGPAIDWTGWQFVRFDLTSADAHWGGANDGKIHYPLVWDSILLLDNSSKKTLEGKVYLASPVLIY